MERLLDLASAACDQAEVYSVSLRENEVKFQDGRLQDIKTTMRSGVSLRVVRDGRLGFSFTRNLIDRAELLGNALSSLEGGVRAGYELPLTENLPALLTYDPALEEVTSTRMVDELTRVADLLREREDGGIRISCETSVLESRILNSRGSNLSAVNGIFIVGGGLLIPGSSSGFARAHDTRSFAPMPDALIDEVVSLFRASKREAKPEGGRMKVLFMPSSLITLLWRIQSGTSARSVHQGISPIAGKQGERIFDPKLTLIDDPRNLDFMSARPFDDEGVPCDRFVLIENGVLSGFYNCLEYAEKLGAEPTGHGYRSSFFGGDTVSALPAPAAVHLRCEPGEDSFGEMIARMDRGIVLEQVLGPHSGNIPNGDFSVGANPGFYVENGEIVGRVRDAMVAGNVYDTLRNIVAIGDTPQLCFGGRMPPILCDSVSVTVGG